MPARSGGTRAASKAAPNRPIWSRWRERAPRYAVPTQVISDFIFSRRGCGALAFAARGATSKSFAVGGAHAPLCLLYFLGSSHTLGVVSRLA
eukprot:COSAG06_NODE_164_length_21596_cov_37.740500_19_plen_92_part_00